jgi:hypothetical protein
MMSKHSAHPIVCGVLAILLAALMAACGQPTPTGGAPTANAAATAAAANEEAVAAAVARAAAAEDTAATAAAQAAAAGDTAATAEAQAAAAELDAGHALDRSDTALIAAQTAISMAACLEPTVEPTVTSTPTIVGGGLAIHVPQAEDLELVLNWSLDRADAFLSYAAFQASEWYTTSGGLRLALIATGDGSEPGTLYYDQSLGAEAWGSANAWSDYSTYEEQAPGLEESRSVTLWSARSPLAGSEPFDPGSGGTVGQSLDNLEIAGAEVNAAQWLLLGVQAGQGPESVLIRLGEGSGAGTPGSLEVYCASCVSGYCCYSCYKAGYATSCY